MARTRANGQPLTAEGLAEDIMAAIPGAVGRELAKDAYAVILEGQRKSYSEGMQLGFKLEHEHAVRALQQAALTVLGKDRGDGAINLGALGSEVFAD